MINQVQDRVEKFAAGEQAEARMTFGEHIEELRGRLIKSIAFLLIMIVVAMVFYKELVSFILAPHIWAMQRLHPNESMDAYRPISGSYGGPILAVMKLAFIVALFISSPFVGYQMWAFIGAGLYKHEKKWVVRFAPISFLLFVIGCGFGFKILVPYCLYGLSNSMDPKLIAPTVNFSEYLSLVMTLTIILGGVFQVPLIMVFLSKIGLVKPGSWNRWRRHAIVVNLLFAAIVTPADIFSMVMVAIPLLVLYEIGFIVSWIVARPKSETLPAKP
jgi:sec-independent protein translocase protein TatC